MQSSERQGSAARVAAWLGVIAVHAGLFWLLTCQDRSTQKESLGERLRLVFVEPVRRSSPPSPPSTTARRLPTPRAAVARPIDQAVSAAQSELVRPAPAAGLMEQARQAAREQVPHSFASDPLRSRRAQLPGGDRGGAFRMKEPVSPAKIVNWIGEAFGNRPPCPDIQARISGLLTATSEHERELLQEELRRDREYCRP